MELVLHELYDGVEQIGHKPGDEEGQKHARETVDDEVCGENCQCDECPANELMLFCFPFRMAFGEADRGIVCFVP